MSNNSEIIFHSRKVNLECEEIQEKEKNIYKKNGEELINDKSESISKHEFKKLVEKEIIEFIYPFDNLVVLAGAGASIVDNDEGKPNKKYGHTIKMLTEDVDEYLEENDDLYSLDEMSRKCKYTKTLKNESDSTELSRKGIIGNKNFVLEDFLSKVISYEEFLEDGEEKNKFKLTKEAILQVIVDKTSYSFEPGVHKHDGFIKVFSNLIKSPYRLSIVTTNYDTLFEEAADFLNFTVFDGFSFTSKPKFDVDLFDWSLVKPIINVKSDKVEYKKNVINLLKIHGSLTWKHEDKEIVRCNKNSNINPIMIFPSSNKYTHSYEKPYFELLSKFQELLKIPDTLFLTTGFSFADNHIAKMITQAIKSNPSLTLLVTSHSIEKNGKNENWKELENLMRKGYRIAFLKANFDGELISYFGEVKDED